jgi:serine/threonine protein phosphatase PrpC
MSLTVATAQGLRDYQEDRSFTYKSELGTVLAVFDGHGGEETAEWLGVNLPSLLVEELAVKAPKDALEKVFKRADEVTHNNHAGSTATVVFIPTDKVNAYIAVLGDSPVIAKFSSGLRHVSPEHNVRTNLAERAAAEARGGFYSGGYIYNSDLGRGLQMGRAFGDAGLGKIVSKEPEIYDIPLGDWLLVCSDGAVDPGHKDSQSVIDKVVKMIEAPPYTKERVNETQELATASDIVKRALKADTHDNVTAILWRR